MNRNKEWLVPLTGVGFLVLGIVSFLVAGEPKSADRPAKEIVAYYVANGDSVEAASFIAIAATALLVWFGAYLRKVLHAAAPEGEMLSLVSFIGFVMVAAGFAIDSTIGFALSEAAGDVDPVAVQALQALGDNNFMLVLLGVLLFLWATGISVIRSELLPKWLGWVMVALGAVALTPLGFASVLGSAILVPTLGIVLSLRARRVPVAA
jgi:hypothetical protein